jgi:hypothetical protein
VFGLVIIGGMLVSGDRIVRGVEQLFRERRRPDRTQTPTLSGSAEGHVWKEARKEEGM